MRVELDFPPACLFPNRAKGTHWTVTHKAKSLYRDNSAWLTKGQLKNWTPTQQQIKLTVTFITPDKRHRDADNCLAAAKAGLDGMADALGVNDKQFQPIIIFREHGGKPGKMTVDIDVT